MMEGNAAWINEQGPSSFMATLLSPGRICTKPDHLLYPYYIGAVYSIHHSQYCFNCCMHCVVATRVCASTKFTVHLNFLYHQDFETYYNIVLSRTQKHLIILYTVSISFHPNNKVTLATNVFVYTCDKDNKIMCTSAFLLYVT